jgi:hypothetical protein
MGTRDGGSVGSGKMIEMSPKRIILTDIVVSAATADRLRLEGWRFERHLIDGIQSFVNYLHVNPETAEVYETSHRGTKRVAIRLETNHIFRAKAMTFGWTDGGVIDETSRIGGILSSYLLMTFERLGYHSYEKDIEKRTLDDYPMARDYIVGRCRDVYHIPVPEVMVIVVPRSLWDTFLFDKYCDAQYLTNERIIAVPNLKWKSRNFEESLIVHEFTHAIQHVKGWLLDLSEMGLSAYDLSKLAESVLEGRPLDLVARDLEKDVRLFRRAKALIDQRFMSLTKYFEVSCEVNAFAEEFRFLSVDRGIPVDRIAEAINHRCLEKGGSLSSRDKALVRGMIEDSDRKIAEAIFDQEAVNHPRLKSWACPPQQAPDRGREITQ